MDTWMAALLSLSLCLAIAALLHGRRKGRLPPGPPAFPIVGNLLWFTRRLNDFELILRELWEKYGPIVTLHLGSTPSIMVNDRGLAHEMLVQHGAAFADRPTPSPAMRLLSVNQHNINTAGYGPRWRLFRRNLASVILHPTRLRQYSASRVWVLGVLLDDLRARARSGDGASVVPMESFQYAMFSLLLFLCFGEKVDSKVVRDIESVQRDLIYSLGKLKILVLPKIATYFFRDRWKKLQELRQRQRELFLPLITARRQLKEGTQASGDYFSYVDSLLDLRLPEEEGGRKLREEEIITLCSELFTAGTDTTSTALQWIMANIVKHPRVQEKIVEEMNAVIGEGKEEVKEDDLQRLPYLKAVVLEGLRRHPPGHFVLAHAAGEEVSFKGYVIPKGTTVNFAVAEMHWDGRVWGDPLEFRPERFLAGGEGDGVDITGNKEIKMMPFGVGRRICPGLGLALLHLELFVANLVKQFEWKAVEGEEVDLAEAPGFTVVMRTPLQARILPRRSSSSSN